MKMGKQHFSTQNSYKDLICWPFVNKLPPVDDIHTQNFYCVEV